MYVNESNQGLKIEEELLYHVLKTTKLRGKNKVTASGYLGGWMEHDHDILIPFFKSLEKFGVGVETRLYVSADDGNTLHVTFDLTRFNPN